MTQVDIRPKMKIAKEKYLFTRRHRHVYIGRLENDHFKYRLEIGGQGYYFDTLAEVSAFLFGRYGHPKLTEKQLEPQKRKTARRRRHGILICL